MNILEALIGGEYPKFETAVCADSDKTAVTVHCTLSPVYVDLDSPKYVETKFKKQIPILKAIWVTVDDETSEQTINVTVEATGKFNSLEFIKKLAHIAKGVSRIAINKLSEPEVVKNIGLNCKPFIDNEEGHEDA